MPTPNVSNEGLAEFPNNPELTTLLRHARQGLERTSEANRLFEEAKAHRSSGDWDSAVDLLRQALDLDKRNIVVQNTLVNLLTERALATLDADPSAAEPIAAEASRLDPDHPAVHKVIDLIAQAKRKHYVEQTVLQARELQTAHRNEAIDILKQGLTVYPNDGRLQQTLSSLQKEEPRAFGATAFGLVTEEKTVVYPTNGGAVHTPPNPAPPPPVKPHPAPKQTGFHPAKQPPAKPPVPPPTKPELPKEPGSSKGSSVLKKTRDAGAVLTENIKGKLEQGSRTPLTGIVIGLVASVIVIGLGSWYLNRHKSEPSGTSTGTVTGTSSGTATVTPTSTHAVSRQIKISTTPADAAVLLDGNPIGATTPPLEEGSTHRISVSRPGYKTIENPAIKVNGPEWPPFALTLEPLQLSVSVADNTGTIWLDDQQIDKLQDGIWSSSLPLKAAREHHVLSVKGKNGNQLFKVAFTVTPGDPPSVEPVQTKDLLVTSSFGQSGMVYAGSAGSNLVVPNAGSKPISQEGVAFKIVDPSGAFSIATGNKNDARTLAAGSAPAIGITLNAQVNSVRATISVSPPDAKLFVDGGPMPRPHKGIYSWRAAARTYQAKLTAEGMEDMEFTIPLKKGSDFIHHYDMKPKAAVASGPNPPTLVINGGEPGATLSVMNGPVLGVLDAKGNGRFTAPTGSYTVELTKSGYSTNNFVVSMAAGKEFEPRGEKKLLKLVNGYARIVSLKPSDAVVTYSRVGESQKYKATEGVRLVLPPGTYEFSADEPKSIRSSFEVKIEPNQEKSITFALQPLNKPQQNPFVSEDDAKPVNGNWYHGLRQGFIPLITEYKSNTLLLSKQFHVKKMSWRVYLDNNNMITYTIDSKGIEVVRRINGIDGPDKVRGLDLTSTSLDAAYAAKIRIEKNAVIVSSQQGGNAIPTTDDKHDWSQAKIYVKGDNYFTLWPGR